MKTLLGCFLAVILIGVVASVELPNCTISRALDVAIVYDESQSMNENINVVKSYLSNLIKMFDIKIKDSSSGVRVAIWGHTYFPKKKCDFKSCGSAENTLQVIDKITSMGATAVNIQKMFKFVEKYIFLPTQGARTTEPNVQKIAIVILDSAPIFGRPSPSKIQQGFKNKSIETYAVVIEDAGVKVAAITPFLNGPAFAVPTKADLLEFTEVREALKSRYGCSKCHPNPCKNNGTCEDKLLPPYYSCKCTAGSRGKTCELTNPCTLCEANGGNCLTLSKGTKCFCSSGKIGPNCEFPNPCAVLTGPCKNGGLCKPNATLPDKYSCLCNGNYTGKNCDEPVGCAGHSDGDYFVPGEGCYSHFYRCSNGKAFIFSCPAGLVFDPKLNVCNWPRQVPGCNTGRDPCAGNPCNGHTCVKVSSTQYRCDCPPYCTKPPDCSGCKKFSPCKPNPCLNGCQCQESPLHEGGFTCLSQAGYLGKLCGLAKAEVECEPSYIEIKIPESVVKKYEAGVSGAQVYVSPTSKNQFSCTGDLQVSEKKYVIKISAPFQQCGTSKTPTANGSEYLNTVWLNRVSTIVDMPVPILKFKCVYGDSQKIVSPALKPALGHVPVLTSSGQFKVSMGAFMKAPGTKDRGPITSGSVYTVGEMIYLTATLELSASNSTSKNLVVKLDNCFASSAPNSNVGAVGLVKDGCPNKAVGVKILTNGVEASATIGFNAFQVLNSRAVYYSCQVQICNRFDLTCNSKSKKCPPRRGKRSFDVHDMNTVRVGPLIILNLDELGNFTDVPLEKGYPVFIAEGTLDEDPERKSTQIVISYTPRLLVAFLASFILFVVLCATALCILIQRRRD